MIGFVAAAMLAVVSVAPTGAGAATVSPAVVVRNLRRHDLPRQNRQPPLDRAILRRLYVDEQLGVRAVAARLGVSPDEVRADLARYRIPIRPPGRPPRHAS